MFLEIKFASVRVSHIKKREIKMCKFVVHRVNIDFSSNEGKKRRQNVSRGNDVSNLYIFRIADLSIEYANFFF
jgi:hypothetical protein